MTNGIQVYGTDWCGVTYGVRQYLTNSRIPYDYYDIERDPHGTRIRARDERRPAAFPIDRRRGKSPHKSDAQRTSAGA